MIKREVVRERIHEALVVPIKENILIRSLAIFFLVSVIFAECAGRIAIYFSNGCHDQHRVAAGYTFGENHDSFVDWARSKGVPDVLANIPSMLPVFAYSVVQETGRSIGLIPQPPGGMCK